MKDRGRGFRWVTSISELEAADWRACFGHQCLEQSFAYQLAVERDRHAHVSFHYLVVEAKGEVEAIVGCFCYEIHLGLLTSPPVMRVMKTMERFVPRMSIMRAFFAGQLTSVCGHLFGLRKIPAEQREAFLKEIEPRLREYAWSLDCSILAIKEIPSGDVELFRAALVPGYLVIPSLPEMALSIDVRQPYASQLRKRYRWMKRRREKEAAERGLTFSNHSGPISESLAARMEELYRSVVERSEVRFEVLSSRFFYSLMQACPAASLVLCHDGDELVGFLIALETQNSARLLYLGFDHKYISSGIYFNLIYRALEEVRSRGLGAIRLGQTSYEAKSGLGAEADSLFLALRARSWGGRLLLRVFGTHLVPQPEIPARNPLKPAVGVSPRLGDGQRANDKSGVGNQGVVAEG